MTWRTMFSMCGKLVGHFPVCSWLCMIAGVLKRYVTAVTKGWDDPVNDAIRRVMEEVLARVTHDDPVWGNWSVSREELNAWINASLSATGVVLERHGDILEDACWLLPTKDAQHINLAELDSTVKGLNLVLQWQARTIHLHTDSMCVYHWLTDTLTRRAQVRTKAASKMLTRRLTILLQLILEYSLHVDVTFVALEQNLADELIRVPKKWLELIRHKFNSSPLMCAALMVQLTPEWIQTIHQQCGHTGIRRTTHFCRRICPSTTKAIVRSVIQTCEDCQSIDPAPAWLENGRIEVGNNWYQLGMDIIHYSGNLFLALTNSRPTRFTVWR